MTEQDIVERLREYVENIRGEDEPPENYLCWQAADEIELWKCRVNEGADIIAGNVAIIDELRAALQKIADLKYDHEEMVDVANLALKGKAA
jgi:hypothetical protein